MLHRFVSRSAGVFAAVAVGIGVAACDDTTTGTPLTPPPPSTAIYVSPVLDSVTVDDDTVSIDYTVKDTLVTIFGIDTIVTIVTPNPRFTTEFPNGDIPEGQIITFSVNLPGFLQQTKDTVDATGIVSPGYWVVARPCPQLNPEDPFCRPVQRVIAFPVAGDPASIDVNAEFAPPPDVATR
jgi:hypothetical protein